MMHSLLQTLLDQQASDLHLSVGEPPLLRIDGRLQRLALPVLDQAGLQQLVQPLLDTSRAQAWLQGGECDAGIGLEGLGRFRLHAFWQLRGAAAAIRQLPQQPPTLAGLGLPPQLGDWVLRPHGLLLVCGATGAGKSTTLAALVQHLASQRPCHILTLEDPIECVHPPGQALIQQREIGRHCSGFASALRAALREDPDCLLIGELRDADTIRLALTAAETGHLVLASLHAGTPERAVDRLIDAFPAGDKELVRGMLADTLLAVTAQVLCRPASGQGRIAALELLHATPAIRHQLREGRSSQLYSAMQTGARHGMQTLDQQLQQLLLQQRITLAEARCHARFPEQLCG